MRLPVTLRRVRAICSLALALATLVQPVVELMHVATVRHVRCAEHDAEVEGGHLSAEPAGRAVVAGGPTAESAPEAAHRHCTLGPGHSGPALAGPWAPAHGVTLDRHPQPPARPTAEARPGSGPRLYRLAPKNSPPVA